MTALAPLRAALARLDAARTALERATEATHAWDPSYSARLLRHCERELVKVERETWPLLEAAARELLTRAALGATSPHKAESAGSNPAPATTSRYTTAAHQPTSHRSPGAPSAGGSGSTPATGDHAPAPRADEREGNSAPAGRGPQHASPGGGAEPGRRHPASVIDRP